MIKKDNFVINLCEYHTFNNTSRSIIVKSGETMIISIIIIVEKFVITIL